MKSVICGIFVKVAIVLTVTAAESSSESEDIEKMIMEQATACQKELKATEKDVKDLLEGVEPVTKVAKCMNACLMNKLGMMDDANKLVPNKLAESVDDSIKSKDGKPLKSIILDVAQACKSVTDPDKCEASVKILSCLNAEAKKRGFDKNIF